MEGQASVLGGWNPVGSDAEMQANDQFGCNAEEEEVEDYIPLDRLYSLR